MNPRSTIGLLASVLAATVLVLAPQAQARETAKFTVLSISGSDSFTRDVAYPPSIYGSCAYTMTERITFHATKRATAYAFTSRSHGRARVAWSPLPEYTHNFTVVEVPGEVTISRSATYQQTNYVDPDTGEVTFGCYNELAPVHCAIERTLPVTLEIGGTSLPDESTYVQMLVNPSDMREISDACYVYTVDSVAEVPGVFSSADLFKARPKRLADTDRKERPVTDHPDDLSETGTIVKELTVELKRKKLRR
jgi:hypothetical protein